MPEFATLWLYAPKIYKKTLDEKHSRSAIYSEKYLTRPVAVSLGIPCVVVVARDAGHGVAVEACQNDPGQGLHKRRRLRSDGMRSPVVNGQEPTPPASCRVVSQGDGIVI